MKVQPVELTISCGRDDMPKQGFGTFSCVMLRSTITVNPCTQPEDGQALITRLTNQTACGDSVESGDRRGEARSLTYVGPVQSFFPLHYSRHGPVCQP